MCKERVASGIEVEVVLLVIFIKVSDEKKRIAVHGAAEVMALSFGGWREP